MKKKEKNTEGDKKGKWILQGERKIKKNKEGEKE